MILQSRDKEIINTVARFRLMLGRQIKVLCGFSGERACDRRLKILINEGYLIRERLIYGVAGIYTVTAKARKDFDLHLTVSKIRLDQIKHDISVVDTAIYLINTEKITLSDIKTEKELRHEQGFSKIRGHEPDFIYKKDGEINCVEVELSLKAKDKFIKNIKSNYLSYNLQKWAIPKDKLKIREILSDVYNQYPNIEIIDLENIN